MSNDGPYKRKVDHGRDNPGKSTRYPTIRMNFDMARPVGVF